MQHVKVKNKPKMNYPFCCISLNRGFIPSSLILEIIFGVPEFVFPEIGSGVFL